MSEILAVFMSASLLGKLGAIASEVDVWCFGGTSTDMLYESIRKLVADPKVQEFLKSPEMRVLLGQRREL